MNDDDDDKSNEYHESNASYSNLDDCPGIVEIESNQAMLRVFLSPHIVCFCYA